MMMDDGLDGYAMTAVAERACRTEPGEWPGWYIDSLYIKGNEVSLEGDDIPWGLSNTSICHATAFLRRLGIRYRAYDSGHYTWNASEEEWRPGMGSEPGVRTVDVEGTPILEWHQFKKLERSLAAYKELLKGDSQQLIGAERGVWHLIQLHFGDDPMWWR